MSSLPEDVNSLQGSAATSIPDERSFVICPQLAGAMRDVCCQLLLQILDTVSNAARNSAISETFPQLDLVQVACSQLLHVLMPPFNPSNAAPHWENQVSGIYPQVVLTATQFEFACAIYSRLLRVYYSSDESNATQIEGNQFLRDSAISQITQLLQIYGMLPSGYIATQLGAHQVLANNASQIQPPVPDTAQPTDAQEAWVPASGDTSGRLPCHHCETTFGRLQEFNRHLNDVHKLPRQCPLPLCSYKWSRPYKIKAHLLAEHQVELPQEILDGIQANCGQRLVTFLDTVL